MKILNIITNVEGKAASEAGKVYNLQGVVVGLSLKNLPKGVYIWNGRKVVVLLKVFLTSSIAKDKDERLKI